MGRGGRARGIGGLWGGKGRCGRGCGIRTVLMSHSMGLPNVEPNMLADPSLMMPRLARLVQVAHRTFMRPVWLLLVANMLRPQ